MQPNRPPAGNFDFLRAEWPQIYDGAVRAERIVNIDARTACFYARRTVEATVRWLYTANGIPTPYKDDLAARLHEPAFQAIVPSNLRQKMDLIRRAGNAAVHDEKPIGAASGVRLVGELFHIMSWLAREFATQPSDRPDPRTQFDPNRLPKPGAGSVAKTVAQIRALNAEMEAKDAALAKANSERDDLAAQIAARDAAMTQQQAAFDAEKAAFDAEKASTDELIAKLRAQVAAAHANAAKPDTHDYNEAQTRTDLIDLLLREAGWALTDERDREYPVVGMPTVDGGVGNGFADYVLWGDDGQPLAVVEAKRTSKDPQAGKHQAKLYADCLEQMTGQRPIIFYTNGIEIYLWDDTRYPPRLVEGFYTRDELALAIQRRRTRKPLADVAINDSIVERHYQRKAIRNVTAHFDDDRARAALLVMATGSGKTRTVIALADLLMRANWVKRVLFLADRKALVRQAAGAFKTHLPDVACVNLLTEKNTDGRVYVSTYPTMMNLINEFDDGQRRFGPGHFDLIVIDEAHRSVYQKYRRIFEYFDGYLLGLTATPKDDVDFNTYQLFNLETGVPTDDYGLDEAIKDGYLVPPRAWPVPLAFPTQGIRYDDLSDEEKQRWESTDWGDDVDDDEFPDTVGAEAVNRWLFNTDTVDKVLEVLMTHGHRVAGGDRLGKTIVFAKNQRHADFITERFDVNYPQYRGQFAAVITHAVSHGEDLIDKFSQTESSPHIAVSVDMLDTGVDIPDVVNLVFFKPIRSKTKFWQMIGRGTRLRPALYGPGVDKHDFRIFDVCGNFDYFQANPEAAESRAVASLSQRLFTTRTDIVYAYDRTKTSSPLRDEIADTLHTHVAGMNLDNFLVRPKRRQVETYAQRTAWNELDDAAVREIVEELAALPTSVTDSDELAKRFDLVVLRAQLAVLEGDETALEKQRGVIVGIAERLLDELRIPSVKECESFLREIVTDEWWADVTPEMLEQARKKLRSLVRLITPGEQKIVYTDFADEFLGDVEEVEYELVSPGTDRERFLAKMRDYLNRQPDNLALQKLKTGKPLTPADLESLEGLLASSGAGSDEELAAAVSDANGLGRFVRSLVGLDRQAVNERFAAFLAEINATAQQSDFVGLVVDHLTRNGAMDAGQLYDPPFTDTAPQGPDQVFEMDHLRRLVTVISDIDATADNVTA